MKDAGFYENKLSLNVVFRQKPSGVTEESKELFDCVSGKIGKAEIVYLIYVEFPNWNYLTYVSDKDRRTLCFDGFSWGYGGEGPSGLGWLFGKLGFEIDDVQIESWANEPGCIGVQPDGLSAALVMMGQVERSDT